MSVTGKVLDVIKRQFLSGVLIVVPFILTFLVLRFLFKMIDGILEPYLHDLLGYYRTGLGLMTTLLIILLAGVLTRNLIGARFFRLGEKLLIKFPLSRPIYTASKQLLTALTSSDIHSFKEVALIEYPRKGVYGLCFISNRPKIETNKQTEQYVTCFVPSTPTPVSGMTVIVPVKDVVLIDMTVEDAVKFLVSGGVASPDIVKEKMINPVYSNNEVANETC